MVLHAPEMLCCTLLMIAPDNNRKGMKHIPAQLMRERGDAYFVVMSANSGYRPTLHEKVTSQPVPISEALELDLSPEGRALFLYVQSHGFDEDPGLPPVDLGELFPLAAASGFPIFKQYHSYDAHTYTIDLSPQRLSAEIICQKLPLRGEEKQVRSDIVLRMPFGYWSKLGDTHRAPCSVQGTYLVRETNKTIELHPLTPLIAGIVDRMSKISDFNRTSETYRDVSLLGGEIERYEEVVADARRAFVLASVPPKLSVRVVAEAPRKALSVYFDNSQHELRITAIVDYGVYQQDIAERMSLGRQHRNSVWARRGSSGMPGSHVVIIEGNEIILAKIDEQRELECYQEIMRRAEEFGFTKTLRCVRKGKRPVGDFMFKQWPLIAAFAKNNGYAVIFEKDELATKQSFFRADFKTDVQADNDWLYFDLDVYCGDERVTLAKLIAYLESGEAFWRKDDGTLVEISNRDELERLARLLKSFHAREGGGYESKLYRAPELEYVMTSSSHYNAARAESFEKFMTQIEEGKPVKPVEVPLRLVSILRPYQKAGIEWMYFLRSYRFAGILADDMGLGKTLQTLCLLSMERREGRPSVVVCPKTLLYNWQSEAQKFFPEMTTLVYEGTPEERALLREQIKERDIVIVSYSTLRQDEVVFAHSGITFNYAVLDEAQFIKNHATKNAQVVKKLDADYRLALTGTPLENSVSELWSIYDFLMPGFLGSYAHFSEHFHRPIMDAGDRKTLEHLRRKVESFMLRRTKAEVLKELPPKIETASLCHLSEPQNVLYQQILAKVRGDVYAAVGQKGFKSAQIHILAGLTKLRQACNHPALLTKGSDFREYQSAKLDMCMELVDEVVESKRKVLIFSQFTQMLDIVSAALKDKGIAHLYLSGKTENRQSMIDSFNGDASIPVFLISMKAGGTGLNLTAADTVIIFDPWWNPSVENQAIDRTHRIGQTKTVNVYRLLTTGTIEEKIQALKQKKQDLFDALIDESGDLFKKLTWDDVRELFGEG